MDKKDFEPHLGKPITTAIGDGYTVSLELTGLEARKKLYDEGRDEPFTLIFKGPRDHHLPDDTYEMTLSDGTRASIFISAHEADNKGSIFYDAVFS